LHCSAAVFTTSLLHFGIKAFNTRTCGSHAPSERMYWVPW
jgi:hypothetical protein